jgi:hypothetical protein
MTVAGSAAAFGVAAGLGLVTGPEPTRFDLILRLAAVGFVWLLTSAFASIVLRIAELGSIIRLMLDLIRRPRPA